MRLASVFSGAAFKTAVLSLVVFGVVLAVVGATVVEVTRDAMIRELEEQIAEELVVFRATLESEGASGVVELTRQLSGAHLSGSSAVGLFDADGRPVAGKFGSVPDFVGWGTYRPLSAHDADEHGYHVNVSGIGEQVLVIGRSLVTLHRVERALVGALLFGGAVVTFISLMIGAIVSRNVDTKLEAMAETLDRVAGGDMSARLAVGHHNDQIDRVSQTMNLHLDRLARLTESARNTIIAIAHELRTPLNRAYLMIQSAGSAASDPDTRAAVLAEAESELEGIGAAFETILRIARIDASSDRAGFEEVDLAELANEVADAYRPVVEDAGRSLAVETGDGAGVITGDRGMLRQMLGNLIDNANRYTPPGTAVTISVSGEPGTVRLSVRDDGPGIPAHLREAALEPFARLGQDRDARGAGLGLALVRAIAERHGARLELSDNAPGLVVSAAFPDPGPDRTRQGARATPLGTA